ncbi:diphthine--ammonia ligase [Candidatus Woesearchaeota archaeon]|nr:MAG: diphthine--ammonia ligase [Candidatus Woesearchaeota archaeon]
MCGIIGVFNKQDAEKLVRKGMAVIKHRGKDARCVDAVNDTAAIGHLLHAVVGHVKQPILGKGLLISNCEIYNWKELNEREELDAKNDAELLLKLLDKKGVAQIKEVLEQLDGVYAFAYLFRDKLILARDIIGVKPLWFSYREGLAFASEKKALEKMGYIDIQELNPRKIVSYDIKTNNIKFIERDFFKITPTIKKKSSYVLEETKKLLIDAVRKRLPNKKLGILFSGGIDSTTLSFICKMLGKKFTCYTAVVDHPGFREPPDIVYAKRVAEKLGFELKINKIKLSNVEGYLKKVVPLIEDNNVVKVEVALTLYAACELAKKDRCKVILSGLGSEEIFAGYYRHEKSQDINKECISGLLKMYERDLYRDDVVTMANNLELRVPFLDRYLVEHALRIPAKLKLDEKQDKIILRMVAQDLGIPMKFASRKKDAAQYGSNIDKAVKKLSKKRGFGLRSEYLRQFYPSHNLNLAALISGGKDSLFAMYVMLKQNYKVGCVVTIISENPESYMFHTPNVQLVALQARAMQLPYVIEKTKGEKEEELKDLKKALAYAKKKYKIEGVITGALYSSYQRDRIEKIADSLGLKIFSPLWHIDQEYEMRQLITEGFEVIFSSVAAEGLDKSWLGRKMLQKDVDKLVELNKRIGLNVALEGGEAETLVLDCPMFKQKIVIKDAEIIMENKNTGIYKIKDAILW